MLLSLLWDEIVADDMKMFSVKIMKLLIWNVLLKLNSKSYHVVKEKRIIYDAILKTRHERNSKIFFFFSPCLVLMTRELARMVENVMWKFQKLNFASSFHQYSNPCEQYFGGEELKVGTFLSTVHIQKNSWIDKGGNFMYPMMHRFILYYQASERTWCYQFNRDVTVEQQWKATCFADKTFCTFAVSIYLRFSFYYSKYISC